MTHGLSDRIRASRDDVPDARTGLPPKMTFRSWRDWLFPGVWLIYLAQTIGGVGKHASGVGAVIGYALVPIFAACYLIAIAYGRSGRNDLFNLAFGGMIVCAAIEPIFAHEDAFPMLVYISVIVVAAYRRYWVPLIVALTTVAVVLPALIPPWHAGFDFDIAITLPLVALAMYGFFAIIEANRNLTEARAEVARLAAENERSRIARDLHDLLGHSLTTITVKSGLAKRLAERDPERAAVEIGEVESLGRRTLAEVRAAVAGYRDVTLTGELATGHEVLRAAGFVADLPKAVDNVDPNYEELLGWVVREGITNVVRHSRGATCTITVGPNWLEIVDDGRGGGTEPGTGLTGLRERVEAAGGTVASGPRPPADGWRLRVDLPAVVVPTPAPTR